MNMYYQLFSNITAQYPNELDAIKTIQTLFDKKGTEYNLDGLANVAHPNSALALTSILNMLVSAGYIRKTFRVISPTDAGGLLEAQSINDIPEFIEDLKGNGESFAVSLENIKIIYKSAAL